MIERAVVEAGDVAAAAGNDLRAAPSSPAGGETADSVLVASPELPVGSAADGDADARSDAVATGSGEADGTHGASDPAVDATGAAQAGWEAPGEGTQHPTSQEDLTLVLTVLLATPGDDLTVVVGARRGERPHARFARLNLPREGWIAALFRGGDPAGGDDEPSATLAAYVADANAALAEEKARTNAARPAGNQSPGKGGLADVVGSRRAGTLAAQPATSPRWSSRPAPPAARRRSWRSARRGSRPHPPRGLRRAGACSTLTTTSPDRCAAGDGCECRPAAGARADAGARAHTAVHPGHQPE